MRNPADPFVTFYDDATGERIELSGTSFENWVNKTANLLRDDFDFQPGDSVSVELPLHWVLPVWIAAVLKSGGDLRMGGPGADITVIGPQIDQADGDVVACSLRPMAQGYAQPTPAGVCDYFSEVRLHGDFFQESRPIAPTSEANFEPGGRLLLISSTDDPISGAAAELVYAAPVLHDGSVVIVRNAGTDTVERIAEQERVTKRLRVN